MYLNLDKTLSHGKLFNFIVGARSIGKTYAFKKWAISSFLKNYNQFVYIRRFSTDFKSIKQFFDDIQSDFPETKFNVTNNTFFINDNIAGYYLPLSKHQSYKSTPFPFVDKICFDEFIIEKGFQRYLPNEVESYLSLYSTIARNRDNVKALFLSNSVSITNPYFNYFNLKIPYNSEFYKRKDILLQVCNSEKYIENKTRFGELIKDTKYYDYAFNNNFILDNNSYVKRKGENVRFLFAINYSGIIYGVWVDSQNSYMCISLDYQPDTKLIYSIDLIDRPNNTLFISSLKNSVMLKSLLKYFEEGCLYYESVNIKNNFMEIIKKLY